MGEYYQVLTNETLIKLVILVNYRIQDGWEPIGGIVMDDQIYYQTMIRRPFPKIKSGQ